MHQLAATGSERGVRNALHRLAETGLVDATAVGPSVQYTLNREHVAAAAVLELTSLRPRLFDRFRASIDAWAIKPEHASIFGSAARGDGNLDSDIDLLIVHRFDKPSAAWEEQLSELSSQALRWSGNYLQTYVLSTDGLLAHLEAAEPIVDDWKRDGVRIHGPEIRTLINQLTHRESA
ncbi:nucleotidyltransferase domain-containing protein [Kribbella sp. NPDC050820]|uniref:nucleotidyltransferase domain-containing protein n=1 Tax=Kribbella sp. NPDC050820 TaxID=3155408 RepID=UPI00340B6FE8